VEDDLGALNLVADRLEIIAAGRPASPA